MIWTFGSDFLLWISRFCTVRCTRNCTSLIAHTIHCTEHHTPHCTSHTTPYITHRTSPTVHHPPYITYRTSPTLQILYHTQMSFNDELLRILQLENLHRRRIIGDGNCFFRSIYDQKRNDSSIPADEDNHHYEVCSLYYHIMI